MRGVLGDPDPSVRAQEGRAVRGHHPPILRTPDQNPSIERTLAPPDEPSARGTLWPAQRLDLRTEAIRVPRLVEQRGVPPAGGLQGTYGRVPEHSEGPVSLAKHHLEGPVGNGSREVHKRLDRPDLIGSADLTGKIISGNLIKSPRR